MSQLHIDVVAVIDAPAEKVYGILADYEVGHPAILPRPAFKSVVVEKGGRGAGTVANARMQAMGAERSFRLVVTEPQLGRVLVESDEAAGTTTSFTVEPLGDKQCRVTIASDVRLSSGVQGWIERLVSPSYLRRTYQQELHNLDEYTRR